MLILTRRIGETLMIGDDVTVTVLDIRGNQARIGIKAPKSVSVNREEVQDRIDREHVITIDIGQAKVKSARAGALPV